MCVSTRAARGAGLINEALGDVVRDQRDSDDEHTRDEYEGAVLVTTFQDRQTWCQL